LTEILSQQLHLCIQQTAVAALIVAKVRWIV